VPKVLELVTNLYKYQSLAKISAPNLPSFLPYLLHRDNEDKMSLRLEKQFEGKKAL
jgi:hypothetical protein